MKAKPVRQLRHEVRHVVRHVEVKENISVRDLVYQMRHTAFSSEKVARAARILGLMKTDSKIFFGLAGAMVPAGMKKIIIDMLQHNYIHVFVTTGATLTHDLVEALGFKHYREMGFNDEALQKKGIMRMYDSYMKSNVYQKTELFLKDAISDLQGKITIKELLMHIGSKIKNKDESILGICFSKKIPIFCPALADSGMGMQIWGIKQSLNLTIDAFDDLKDIIDLAWTSKKNSVFYVGGGTPKNFIQQAMQFANPASYGIQITTDRPEFGGSSGAPLQEGISWHKMKPNANFVDVICDATIALPLIYLAAR